MKPAPTPSNEATRLRTLHQLGLLDTLEDERFDGITRLTQHCLNVPIAVVSLVDTKRQWFKSVQGLSVRETPRDISFCGHAIAEEPASDIFVVEDAQRDERFRDNPLVTGEPAIRFYAGRILKIDGQPIGTLCIIDHKPRKLTAADREKLNDLAVQVEHEIEGFRRRTPPNVSENQYEDGFQASDMKNATINLLCNRFTATIFALITFVLLLALGDHWHALQLEKLDRAKVKQANEMAARLRGTIETELNSRLYLTKGLAGLVHSNSQFTDDQFQRFASFLGDERSGIRSLQLAPDGVVKYVWPLESNRGAIGHDLLADPSRKAAAESAIAARQIWLAGPLTLIQGGQALIGRLPIFSHDNEQETFWGFGTILIDLDKFFEDTGLKDEGVRNIVSIRGKDAQGKHGEVFFGKADTANRQASTEVSLPAGSWEISVTLPKSDGRWQGQELFWGLVIALSSFLALAVYVLLRLPMKFRTTVDQTTAALRAQESLFRDAVEALPDGFLIFDADDRLVTFNERIKTLFATSKAAIFEGNAYEEILRYGYTHGQFKQQDEHIVQDEDLIQARLKQRENGHLTVEESLDSGKWVRIVERPIQGGGTVCFVVDITQLKYNEAELSASRDKAEAANEAKSNFLATVSHEVRTPMNVILGLIETVSESAQVPDKEKKLLVTANQSAKQLLHILNEILDISKMESKKLLLEPVEFTIEAAVHNVMQLAQPMAQEKGLSIETDIRPSQHQYFLGDTARLQQILFNLLSNAVKFTDVGKISLTAEQLNVGEGDNSSVWSFTVKDTGKGFDPNLAEQLFEPFFQLDGSAQREHEGTGLGLSICKKLVELMGGSITATSTPNQGSEFSFELPLQVVDSAPASQDKRAEENDAISANNPPLNILLAEDSMANQIVFTAMLETAGHNITVVEDGESAVDACKQETFDIILMDIFMPRMDGVTATKHIREDKLQANTPIVALTASAMKGDQERFLAAGMDGYLSKPVSKEDLIDKIHKLTSSLPTPPSQLS